MDEKMNHLIEWVLVLATLLGCYLLATGGAFVLNEMIHFCIRG